MDKFLLENRRRMETILDKVSSGDLTSLRSDEDLEVNDLGQQLDSMPDDVVVDAPKDLSGFEQLWLKNGNAQLKMGIDLMRDEKYEQAAKCIRSAMPCLERANAPAVLAQGYHHLGLVAHFDGRPWEGIEPMEKAVKIRQGLPNFLAWVTSLVCLSVLHRNSDNTLEAIHLAETSISHARREKFEIQLVLGLVALARALTVEGEHRDRKRAVGTYEEAMDLMKAYGRPIPSVVFEDLAGETIVALLG